MKGVILAAGRGTRLNALGGNKKPKVLFEVGDKTCLEHIICGMRDAGIKEFVVVIGYLGEMIKERYGTGEELGVKIDYVYQDLEYYGTGRAVQLVEPLVADEPFMLSYGDIIVEPENYKILLDNYSKSNKMVMSLNWVDDPSQGGAVYLDEDGRVKKIIEKPTPGSSSTNWNNAGLFIFEPVIFKYLKMISKSSRGEYELTDAISLMLEDDLEIRSFKIIDFWQDIGTPDDLFRIDAILKESNN